MQILIYVSLVYRIHKCGPGKLFSSRCGDDHIMTTGALFIEEPYKQHHIHCLQPAISYVRIYTKSNCLYIQRFKNSPDITVSL